MVHVKNIGTLFMQALSLEVRSVADCRLLMFEKSTSATFQYCSVSASLTSMEGEEGRVSHWIEKVC